MTAIDCLRELVALKKLKDRLSLGPGMIAPSAEQWASHGAEWEGYHRRKPLAWAAAHAITENAAAQEALAPDGKATLDYLGGQTKPTLGNAPTAPPVAAAPTGASAPVAPIKVVVKPDKYEVSMSDGTRYTLWKDDPPAAVPSTPSETKL